MSGLVAVNFWAALGKLRVTADARMLTLQPERVEVETSALEDKFDTWLPGTYKVPGELAGRVNGNAQRAMLEEMVAEGGAFPYILHPPGTAAGSLSFFLLADLYQFSWEGERGNLFTWKAKVLGSSQLYTGYALAGWPGQAPVAADGSSANFEAVALGANQKLVLALAILDPPGVPGTSPELTITLETDVDGAFGTPTVVATSQTFTEPGYEVIEIDGDTDPISDTFYRLTYDIEGTDSPSFQVMAAFAVVSK